jgi:hypothetical protein
MTHQICDSCETVAHCTNHGCIPLQPHQAHYKAVVETVQALFNHRRAQQQPYNPEPDVRELAKWLNEEPNRDLNRPALARVLAYYQTHN